MKRFQAEVHWAKLRGSRLVFCCLPALPAAGSWLVCCSVSAVDGAQVLGLRSSWTPMNWFAQIFYLTLIGICAAMGVEALTTTTKMIVRQHYYYLWSMLLLPPEPARSHYRASGTDLAHVPVTCGALSRSAHLALAQWLVVTDLSWVHWPLRSRLQAPVVPGLPGWVVLL